MVISANESHKYEWPRKGRFQENGLSVSGARDRGWRPRSHGRLRCGVRNTGYSEEISKEGEGRSRLSSYCSSEIREVQGSSIHLYI